ncbi:MAG TPA: peptidoglycan bridge formation glycyltransferase FemA/FemB family protein, partial [Actinomycetota bacterium]|nr:peptidoglycan bridge formation glycyltransferase FemA/FemB family protein [Actinomycetota bacterium]
MSIAVRPLSAEAHLAFVQTQPSVSFLQTPAWAGVKAEWDSGSVGWFDGDSLVGAALVLYRQVPRVKRYLAYIPEGPVLPWDRVCEQPDAWLSPLTEHTKQRGAFALKMGPAVATRRWHAQTVKQAIADDAVKRLADAPADEELPTGTALQKVLRAEGWVQEAGGGAGFGDVQPRYVYQLPLAGRTADDVFAGFNQLWRRNIRKAEKSGVEVVEGDRADLALFHPVYVETAERDGFTPRGLSYFQRMWDAMNAEDPRRLRLYLARHEGQVVAATTLVTVGEHAWYSYGASTTASRNVRPSNAVQWRMITDSLASGCGVYDLRGISDNLT